jgi:hypothetical protein
MPQSAIEDMAKAVPDELIREVVADLRSGRAEPGGFVPAPQRPVVEALKPEPEKGPEGPGYMGPGKGKGWRDPLPLEPRGDLKWIDQAMDMQDALDRRELQNKLRRL